MMGGMTVQTATSRIVAARLLGLPEESTEEEARFLLHEIAGVSHMPLHSFAFLGDQVAAVLRLLGDAWAEA